jgi:hypothetical protein
LAQQQTALHAVVRLHLYLPAMQLWLLILLLLLQLLSVRCCECAVAPTCSSEVLLTACLALLPCLLARQREGGVLERDSMLRCPANSVLLDDLAIQNALLAAASVLVIWKGLMQ